MTGERRRTLVAWAVFVVVVFGVLNAGVDRATERELEVHGPTTASEMLDGARLLYTDSADPRRYFAYANAVLGRACSGYYVRSEAAWQGEFAQAVPRDPDAVPDLVPARPLVPYRDFAVEYPPLFFAVVVPVAAVVSDADGFRVAFGLEMAVMLALALVLAMRLARRCELAIPDARLIGWMAVAALLLGVVVTHRFDAVVALLVVGALVAVAEDRPVWAGALLGIAIGLKLVPAVIAPILAMRWIAGRRWGALARALIAGTVAIAVTLGPLWLIDRDGLAAILRYHAARPLQVESTWASVLRLIAALDGSELQVVRSYGSINVTGTHAGAALVVCPLALAAGWLLVLVQTWRHLVRATGDAPRALVLVRGTLAMLVISMVLGKVFSPQYVVWLLPLAVPVALADGRRSLAVLVGILLLTQIIYPIGNPALQQGAVWMSVLVVVRNFTLLGWALRPLLCRGRAPT